MFCCCIVLFCSPVYFPCVVPLFVSPVLLFPVRSFIRAPLFLCPSKQAYAVETEVHRRARVVAEGEHKTLHENMVKMEKALSKARASFSQLRVEIKTAVKEAEVTKAALDAAIAAATAAAENSKVEFNECRLYQEERRGGVIKELRKARLKANSLSSSITKLKKAREVSKQSKGSDKVVPPPTFAFALASSPFLCGLAFHAFLSLCLPHTHTFYPILAV